MGKLVVSEFVSVDGVMDGPGGEPDYPRSGWAFEFDRGKEGDRFKLDELFAADKLLLGRRTYEGFAAAWPGRDDEAGFAAKMNGMPKYVVSKTLTDPKWNNSTVLGGDLAEDITRLKEEPGDILVAGSCRLVHALTEHGLVDEYRLMVFPIILGLGKRMFGDTSDTANLRLTEVRPVGTDGVVVMTYAAKR